MKIFLLLAAFLLVNTSLFAQQTDSLQITLDVYSESESDSLQTFYEDDIKNNTYFIETFLTSLIFALIYLLTQEWFFYSLILIALIGGIWAISRVVYQRKAKAEIQSVPLSEENELAPSKTNFSNKLTSTLGVIGLCILGCFAGVFVGIGLGKFLGYTGGNSIGTFMLAIFGLPIGGIAGLVLGIILRKKKNKRNQS